MSRIYLDHNASTACPAPVMQAMLPFFSENFGNASSIHKDGQTARKSIEDARALMAKFINAASSEEIIFTSGGTESNNQAIKGALETKKIPGKRVVSSTIEHSAVRSVLKHLAETGAVDYVPVPVHPSGIIDLVAFEQALTSDTFLATVMSANNETGVIQPVAEMAACCRKRGIPFHCDAVQAAGKYAIDVQAWDVDMLSLSAHKFGGPKGIGLLYVRRGTRLDALILGGKQEKNRRAGTENVAGIIGMAKAAEIAMSNLSEHESHLSMLRDHFEKAILEAVPLAHVNGDPHHRVCNTTNICFEYTDSTEALMALDLNGVVCSNGSACHAGSPEPSHVLLAMGLPQDHAHASLRFSLGAGTSEDDINRAVPIIQATIERLRKKHPLWQQSA